jgi:hypothetical protein
MPDWIIPLVFICGVAFFIYHQRSKKRDDIGFFERIGVSRFFGGRRKE